ncbi:AAA-like domain-containing protein [Candidatus Poribacteria bacterium]|nr:AAA-like domain-containing protein [Candidatus Poribacteria bacterium]
MRCFETRGPVDPQKNYVVSRIRETTDFINRIKDGRYVVIFAPRQTGKTTFFRQALQRLTEEVDTYFPIQLDFQIYSNVSIRDFYGYLFEDICREIHNVFKKYNSEPTEELKQYLETANVSDHISMMRFFEQLMYLLKDKQIVLIIDEFDGIPTDALSDFLYSLRQTYITRTLDRSPYSLGIIGVKSITQLNYDRSISPFNIQDDFNLPNFTLEQVHELLFQYTEESGQAFEGEVIEMIHRQTGGQPFLVNRFGQILTEELDIPKTDTILMEHFLLAHTQIIQEGNINIQHLITNIRRDPSFKTILMHISSYENGLNFNPYDEQINELVTYGVIAKGTDNQCRIVNPIYQQCILQAFRPLLNGLEHEYHPEETEIEDYITSDGYIDFEQLLDNFQDFITRVGFRILQVPDSPQEFIGQELLYAYLDQFVRIVRCVMFLEAQTGRGRMDLIVFHQNQKYIVETKIWEGEKRYRTGKKQLLKYMKLENTKEGYYIVFDHRENPNPLSETETMGDLKLRSYVIPILQIPPSSVVSK